MASIEERVKRLIIEQIGVDEDEVRSNTSICDDLGADSLDTIELVIAAEEEFNIEIPNEDADKVKTVGDFVKLVSSQVAT